MIEDTTKNIPCGCPNYNFIKIEDAAKFDYHKGEIFVQRFFCSTHMVYWEKEYEKL